VKLVAAIVLLLASLCATVARAQSPRDHRGVQNVVITFQENRTPDNLFGSNPNFLPGVDVATRGVNSSGQTIPLRPLVLANRYDLSHTHSSFLAMYDNGKMDGADKIPVTCGTTRHPPKTRTVIVGTRQGASNPLRLGPHAELLPC
jgi:phospholipase C